MALVIHNADEKIKTKFIDGSVVLRISITNSEGRTRDHGMVIMKSDYERKLYTHVYRPLLWLAPFQVRLSYLYGCLNTEFNRQKTCTYTFWWREINTSEWNKWFDVNSYKESLY